MSRNGSGIYSLPAGQPVVTGTVIDSTVFNTAMNDIAAALTASIAKDGQTTPTANLPLGGNKITGLGDATLATDAMNRQASDARYAQLGASSTFTVNPTIQGTVASLTLYETDAAANNGKVQLTSTAEGFSLSLFNDALSSASDVLRVERTGITVDSVALTATAITVNGVNVTDFARLSQSNTFIGANNTFQNSTVIFKDTTAPLDEKGWFCNNTAGLWVLGTISDAGAGVAQAIAVDRNGTTVSSIALTATAITLNGVSVSNAAILTSGTLGAVSGVNVTNLNANNLASGSIPDARLSGTYNNVLTLPNAANAFTGVGTNLTALNATQLTSGALPAARMPALTGDVTTSAGAVATTIANSAVTYAKMQNVSATSRVLGRITAGAGVTEELTGANLSTIIGLATIATTGSASDLGSGTIPSARVTTIDATCQINSNPVGYRNIPPSATATTLAIGDVAKCVVITATINIPASVFAAGDAVTIYNDSAGALNLTTSAGTLRLHGTATTGTRSIAQRGFCTIWFKTGGATPEVIASGDVS